MKQTALILGASGAVGKAAINALAEKGYDFYLVHRDRRVAADALEIFINEIRANGSRVVSFNANINEEKTQTEVIEKIKSDSARISIFVHAIADGNVGKAFSRGKRNLDIHSYIHTFTSMAASFAVWTQLLANNDLLVNDSRVIGLTSEGSYKVLDDYMAVGMAKAALEAACRYMAVELAPTGIRVNLINAGIIDTPALRVFEGHQQLIDRAVKRNPSGRITTPQDIAKIISFLASSDSAWITGEIIRADGGEQLMPFS